MHINHKKSITCNAIISLQKFTYHLTICNFQTKLKLSVLIIIMLYYFKPIKIKITKKATQKETIITWFVVCPVMLCKTHMLPKAINTHSVITNNLLEQ